MLKRWKKFCISVLVGTISLCALSATASAHCEPTQYETWNVATGKVAKVDSDSMYFFDDLAPVVLGSKSVYTQNAQYIMGEGMYLWKGATYRAYSSNNNIVRVDGIDCNLCDTSLNWEANGVRVTGVAPGTATVYLERTYNGQTKVVDSVQVKVSYIPSSFKHMTHTLDLRTSINNTRLYDIVYGAKSFYFDASKETGLGEQKIGTIDAYTPLSKYTLEVSNGGKMYLGKYENSDVTNGDVYLYTDKVGDYHCKITEVNPYGVTKVLADFTITVKAPQMNGDRVVSLSNHTTVDSNGGVVFQYMSGGIQSWDVGAVKYWDNRYNWYFYSPDNKYYNTANNMSSAWYIDMFGNRVGGELLQSELDANAIITHRAGSYHTGTVTVDVYRQLKTGGPVEKFGSCKITVVE